MQESAVGGRSNADPSMMSNEVRLQLSTTTNIPDLAELLYKNQRLRTNRSAQNLQEDDTKRIYPTLQDTHKRSHSLRSQHSQALSRQSTNDTSSSSDSRFRSQLTRDDSYLSSIPTSPEDEFNGSLTSIAGVRKNSKSNLVVNAPVNAPRTNQESDSRRAWEILQLSKEDLKASTVPDISTGRRYSACESHIRQPSNLDKPLPIPKELLSCSSATAFPAARSAPSTLPAKSVIPAANHSSASRSQTVGPMPHSPVSKTDSSEPPRQIRSKSAMGHSSKDTRLTETSKSSSPAKGEDALFSIFPMSLTASYRLTRSPSPMHDSSHKSTMEADASSRLHSPSRSSSPFFFRRGNSWLGGSKLDYYQDRHLKAPAASRDTNTQHTSSSASSSSSHNSSGTGYKTEKSLTTSIMPNFSRTLRPDLVKRSSIMSDVNASKKSMRPPLHRHRSKSMDVMQVFKGDGLVTDLKDVDDVKHIDSIAVGRPSVIEVEVPSAVDSTVEGHHDRSRLSRLLSRKPSRASLQSINIHTKEMLPTIMNKNDNHLPRPEGREGALSRLTESLLGKKSASIAKEPMKASSSMKDPPIHRRGHSLDQQRQTAAIRPLSSTTRVAGQKEASKRSSYTSPNSTRQESSDSDKITASASRRSVRAGSTASLVNAVPAAATSTPTLSKTSSSEHIVESKSVREIASLTHSRSQSSGFDDDFYSIASMTPSNSQQADLQRSPNVLVSNKISSSSSSKRVSVSRKSSPPSAYREWASDRKASISRSESDPILSQVADEKPSRTVARANTVALAAASKETPALPTQKGAVLITKNKPLPSTTSPAPLIAPKSDERRKKFHKPSLSVDVKASAIEDPARPNSAMELTKRSTHQHRKRPSQVALSIVDDMEFLQALEHVRKVNQDRIKKQSEDEDRISQMARMGMASISRRAKGREQDRGRQDTDRPRLRHSKRSASAHERSNSLPSTKSDPIERPSALELGVGKASGKMQDGAFINDDDWKKEVKALFIIREMVLTERSYSRHLEALLQSVCALYPVVKKKAGSSMSRNSVSVPHHIVTMRRLLPQLIALSRGLADRIDADPTAAGVGTAFRLIGVQMEATFIAWSSAVTDIMNALRISEKTNSKTKDRIGLISLGSIGRDEVDEHGRLDGLKTVPTSPISAFPPLQAVSTEIAPIIPPTSDDNPAAISFRRRSTLSGLSPSLTASIRSKAMLSLSSESSRKKSGDPEAGSIPASKPSQPKPKTRSDSMSLPPKSRPLFSLSPGSNTTTTPISGSIESITSKKLSAMDVVIMPTQRLLRYLLLIKDLNSNTPLQSLSHIRLQRCLDTLSLIASKCDKASSSSRS